MIELDYNKSTNKLLIRSDDSFTFDNLREHFSTENKNASFMQRKFKTRNVKIPTRKYVITPTGLCDIGLYWEIRKYFIEKQIILNSGRLVFNSTTDHILLSSAQSIGFNAVKGFNFDTKANFVVSAPSIKLGSKNATEPLLLGNETTKLLSKLVINLKAWMTVASPLFASTPGGVAGLPTITSQLVSILSELETNLKKGTIKSKNNFTV